MEHSSDLARLRHIGWRDPALPDDPRRLARVVAQHRAGYELHDGSSAFNAQPAGPFLKRDGIFSTLAGGFGSDALAIVFAGRGSDGIAGAQAVYDAGGRVWVETVAVEQEAGHIVTGIREERVADFAGDVRALAQKLVEEFP